MKDLRSLLTDADPVRAEPALSDADAARMRNVILSSGRLTGAARAMWPDALAVAAVVMLMVAAGGIAGRRLPPRDAAVPGAAIAPPAADTERRQLQFATPGGTRIIWTLDPDFKLREVVP